MQPGKRKTDLTPLRDRLVMPEDREETPAAQKLSSTPMRPETVHAPNAVTETAAKAQKSTKSSKFRDSTLSSKHRSSKRQEYADFYGTSEPAPVGAKVPKDRLRHRLHHREKSGEVAYGAAAHPELKPAEAKPADYSDPKCCREWLQVLTLAVLSLPAETAKGNLSPGIYLPRNVVV